MRQTNLRAVETPRGATFHAHYLVTASVSAIVLALLFLFLRFFIVDASGRQFLVCGTMGAAGALLSVWQRFPLLPIERYTSRLDAAVGAISRLALGLVSGAIFLLIQKAGLLLTVLTNDFALAAAALVAGFAERLIPDLNFCIPSGRVR